MIQFLLERLLVLESQIATDEGVYASQVRRCSQQTRVWLPFVSVSLHWLGVVDKLLFT